MHPFCRGEKVEQGDADEVIYPIMIPIMSSMMLFFIKVEKNRMIPITSMEPMNAPIMTDRNPDKVNTPAVIVPAPASMTKQLPNWLPN